MVRTIRDVYRTVQTELAQVESEMQQAVSTLTPKLHEAATYFLQASGKRIRPMMTILAAKLGQADQNQVVKVAASLEMIHLGSLVHDDVVDEAESRRGQPSVNNRYGNKVAVLLGDYFFSRSLQLASQVGVEAVQVVSSIIGNLVEGEFEQLSRSFDVTVTEEDYWTRIQHKTAFFLAECCRLGGIYSPGNPLQPEDLHAYGLNLGLAFQLKDDLLDFMGTTEVLGKPSKRDLQDGVITLPVIHALQHHPRRDELIGLISGSKQDAWERIISCLQEVGSLEFAEQRAAELVSQAKDKLAPLPQHEAKEALLYLADFVLTRVS